MRDGEREGENRRKNGNRRKGGEVNGEGVRGEEMQILGKGLRVPVQRRK